MPRSGWVAAGMAAAAAANGTVGTGAMAVLVAGLLVMATGLGIPAIARGHARVPLIATGLGVVMLAFRILVGPPSASPSPLPVDGGPWQAVVESVGAPRDGAQVARLRLRTPAGDVVVAATLPAFPVMTAGAVVEVDGRLRPPPDDHPYGEYLRRTGASGTLDARSLHMASEPPLSLQTLRDGAGDGLRRSLPEPEAGLAAGILIGLRERVDRDLAADFATAGVSHVVAISGWNIAIVAGLVGAVMRGRPRRIVTIAVLATVVAYVIAAGASPSVVRAAVMAGVVLLARESGRAGRAPAALGAAAAILLLVDPALIDDAGFRLSVLATAGLLAWANPIAAWLGRLGGGRMPGWLAESLGISLAAQAATLPDVLATFGRLSVVAPAVNLAVVPLVPVAMAGGVIALAGGVATSMGAPTIIGTVSGLPGWLVLHVIVALVRIGAAVPFAAVALPPGIAQAAGIAAAVMLLTVPRGLRWARRRPRRLTVHRRAPRTPAGRTRRSGSPLERAAVVIAAIVVAISATAFGDAAGRSTRLTILDVGQGDAILLETRTGARILVDGGPDPERVLLALDERIPPWDRRLDVVVLTHPHEDHVAGLARILERYAVRRVYEPGMRGPGPGWAAWDAILHDGPARGILAAGARIRLGEVALSVLWPDPGSVPLEPADSGTGINNVSIVLLGEANGRRFLLTGDVEEGVDPALIARGLPTVDVLKVAHHGSATATTQPLLDALRPRVAVASAGADNPYGHPARSTLSRLRDVGARVFRTDEDGSVAIELRDDGLRVAASGPRRSALRPGVALASVPGTAASNARPALYACAIPIPAGSPAAVTRTTGLPGPAAGTNVAGSGVGASPPPRLGPRTRPATAWAVPTGYDRGHDDPGAPRRRPPAALTGAAVVVPAARVRRRGHRGLAGGPDGGERARAGYRAARGGGPAPRRGQAAAGGSARPLAPRRRLGGLAGGTRHGGARAGGP